MKILNRLRDGAVLLFGALPKTLIMHLALPIPFCSFGFAELVIMHGMIRRFLLVQMFSCSFFVRPKKEPKKGRRK
jgi:hypothetical protein